MQSIKQNKSHKIVLYLNIITLLLLYISVFFITRAQEKKNAVIINAVSWVSLMYIICYIHNTHLLKKLIILNKFVLKYIAILPFYILSGAVMMYYTTMFVNKYIVYIPRNKDDSFLSNLIVVAFWLPIASAFYLAMRSFMERNEKKNIENEKLKMEISYLKDQINPHFFFNTLNNLYGLSLEKSPKAPEMIIKLSELMHYNIYESVAEKVSIIKEINCMETYIELKKMCLNDFSCTIKKEIFDDNVKIAPKILINFIENAFKHGVEKGLTNSFIDIYIKSQDKKLMFSIKNNYSAEGEIKKSYGVGLENAKKQLSLIYSDQYDLDVLNESGVFKVILQLNCKEYV